MLYSSMLTSFWAILPASPGSPAPGHWGKMGNKMHLHYFFPGFFDAIIQWRFDPHRPALAVSGGE